MKRPLLAVPAPALTVLLNGCSGKGAASATILTTTAFTKSDAASSTTTEAASSPETVDGHPTAGERTDEGSVINESSAGIPTGETLKEGDYVVFASTHCPSACTSRKSIRVLKQGPSDSVPKVIDDRVVPVAGDNLKYINKRLPDTEQVVIMVSSLEQASDHVNCGLFDHTMTPLTLDTQTSDARSAMYIYYAHPPTG